MENIAVSKNNDRKVMMSNGKQKNPVAEGKRKYNFQTSIDDEFLSLFAN